MRNELDSQIVDLNCTYVKNYLHMYNLILTPKVDLHHGQLQNSIKIMISKKIQL